jgi:hypothetical protein
VEGFEHKSTAALAWNRIVTIESEFEDGITASQAKETL